MDESAWCVERQTAIHLLRSGKKPKKIAAEMRRSMLRSVGVLPDISFRCRSKFSRCGHDSNMRAHLSIPPSAWLPVRSVVQCETQ
jgi:hypothetical protein